MKKYLLITIGMISLAFGIAGIVLPILPTTPFLLLSATCFMKSSKRLYNWVISHKVFGNYINNYIEFRAITLKSKFITISFLWITILSSAYFFVSINLVRLIMILIAIAVTVHILLIKTLNSDMQNKLNNNILNGNEAD